MPECKLFEDCILFSKVDFLNSQKILNSSQQEFKSCCEQTYCDNNFKQCARYQVVKALGRERVPDLLLPPQTEIANQLIEKTDLQREKGEESKYRKIFESAPMGIMLEDKTGTILEVNEALCEITGYNQEELEGNKVYDTLVPSGLEEEAAKNISKVMVGEDLEMLVRSDTKEGDNSYTKICEKKVVLPNNEEVIISMQADLTKRKEDDGSDFVFIDINKRGQEMDGIDRKEILNKSVMEVFLAVKEFGLFAVLKKVYKTGTPEDIQLKNMKIIA